MTFPDASPWLAYYQLKYRVVWSNASDAVGHAQALYTASLGADASAAGDSNGFACAGEYTPSTCGACASAGCGPVADYYSALLNDIIPDAVGFEEGLGSFQTGPWGRDRYYEQLAGGAANASAAAVAAAALNVTSLNGLTGLSSCLATPGAPSAAYGESQLSASWVVPADMTLYTVVGRQRVGGTGVRLYVSGTGRDITPWRTLLCASSPTYGTAESPSPGFLVGMSVCDFRDQPRQLLAGSVLTVASSYWASGAAPFPLDFPSAAAAAGGGEPSPFQVPWTGAVGLATLQFSLDAAPDGAFPWFTSNGMQPPGDAACAPAVTAAASGTPPYVWAPTAALLSASPLVYLNWTISSAGVTITVVVQTGHWFAIGLRSGGSTSLSLSSMAAADVIAAQNGGDGVMDVAEYWATSGAELVRKTGSGNGLSGCAVAAGAGWQALTLSRPLAAGGVQGASIVPGAMTDVVFALGAGLYVSGGRAGGAVTTGGATVTW
jgi:hypothetical protein